MKQEAPDKLLSLRRHLLATLLATGALLILVLKGDSLAIEGEQALIGDRHGADAGIRYTKAPWTWVPIRNPARPNPRPPIR